ncbi:MAG: Fpg/Nei family DNA glycosylase [Candidatus Eisenbacteria sp.]|nr:Fpg/Nei family DNA glycosylase [Candidatus Eisenbacteria bacterium]
MPELPEISSRAKEMQKELTGKTIKKIGVLQPKCLNVSKKKFTTALKGAKILGTTYHGKWLFTSTTKGYLLINMGMGGELLLVDSKSMPEKWRIAFHFKDHTTLALNFWWFGYTHYATEGKLNKHTMSAKLGPNAIDVTLAEFRGMLSKRKGAVKSFLLNQERIAGIGNAYVHDILFLAGLHPLRTIDTLTDNEIKMLWNGIQKGLKPSLRKRGAFYERDLYGKRGGFKMKDILVGYREGKPCPSCGKKVVKIKTGSTSSFICPKCQPLKPKRGAGKKTVAKKTGAKKPKKPAAKRTAAKKLAKKAKPTARKKRS